MKTRVLVGVLALSTATAMCAEPPTFNRDIRPILAANCFACHGPDEDSREAELRLDLRSDVVADRDGSFVVKPGNPSASDLIARITSADPDTKMPPPDSDKTLTKTQIETLRRWIKAGANYERHWAFIAPQQRQLPNVKLATWPRNAIDYFVLKRLETEGLKPSPVANRYTLVRRVYLDLIGLPPTPEEADAFVAHKDPQAYENLIERLLKSKDYGERWARLWLDLARYADTNGYEKDRPRSIWPYRNWVIRAINNDMPFDQFSIEQLAGDMLPNATADQRIATGFHRNTMLNEEGGIDPLEYRFYAITDRVATTGTVWMGLTTGCAQCHSHKYDPITHQDYYRLMALLDNADEPDLLVPDADVTKRRRAIEDKIAQQLARLADRFPPAAGDGPIEARRRQHLERKLQAWIRQEQSRAVKWTILRPYRLETNLPKLELLEDGSVFSSGDITKRDVFTIGCRLEGLAKPITALRLEVLPDSRLPAGGPGRAYYEGRKGDFFLSEIAASANRNPVEFAAASHSFGKISIGSGNANATNVFDSNGSTGWSTSGREGKPSQLVLNFKTPLVDADELQLTFTFERHFAASLGRFRLSATSSTEQPKATTMPVRVESILSRDPKSWTAKHKAQLRDHFLSQTPELAEARKQIDRLRRQLPNPPMTMVMQERPHDNPRPTHRHHRGEYLNVQEKVTPGIPKVFGSLAVNPSNRLEFARWLVSKQNPLVGRVTVNRAWQAFFGRGLVRTSGDFGTQAASPTHPQLLDWLAVEFIKQGWSLKKLHRLIVMSATYRQSSRVTPNLLRRDPENLLLARAARVRVDAEMVRDIVLKASGLLSKKVGGPSVFPPQPASVTALAYGNTKWRTSKGEDRYRRSLYTFSKRTAPFAASTVFNAPTGESCVARRDRSNTPLQALTLLNDEMFLELVRAIVRSQAEQQSSIGGKEMATSIFRRLLTRPPTELELRELVKFQQTQRKRLESGQLKAAAIGGNAKATPEFASWVMVARVIMNLDETITKE